MIQLRPAARLLLPLALALSGCTMSTLGAARPISPGTAQTWLAPSVLRVDRGGSPLVTPQLELGGRYGISERLEAGARVWLPMPGYQLEAKLALIRSDSPDRGFDISIAPGAGYLYAPGGSGEVDGAALHVASFFLPLLIGWNTGGGDQLVFAPKLVDVLSMPGGTGGMTTNMVMAGASLSYVWRLTEQFSIVPELSAGTMVAGSLSGFGTDFAFGGTNLQFSLGFLFGGHSSEQPLCPAAPGSGS